MIQPSHSYIYTARNKEAKSVEELMDQSMFRIYITPPKSSKGLNATSSFIFSHVYTLLVKFKWYTGGREMRPSLKVNYRQKQYCSSAFHHNVWKHSEATLKALTSVAFDAHLNV